MIAIRLGVSSVAILEISMPDAGRAQTRRIYRVARPLPGAKLGTLTADGRGAGRRVRPRSSGGTGACCGPGRTRDGMSPTPASATPSAPPGARRAGAQGRPAPHRRGRALRADAAGGDPRRGGDVSSLTPARCRNPAVSSNIPPGGRKITDPSRPRVSSTRYTFCRSLNGSRA